MNDQAEYSIIGSILLDNSILDEIALLPDHFQDLTNQNIFRAMLNIKKKGYHIDAASLKDELGETGYIFIGGRERLQELKDCVPSIHGFKSYEQMVLNQWKVNTAREIMTSALNSEISADSLQELIKDLSKVDEEGLSDDFDLLSKLQNIHEAFVTEVPLRRSGISSGFKDIDNKTDGFHAGNLIIIGARPSVGKTALLLNMAINAATESQAIPIVFSLEMIDLELLKRMVSCIAEINGMRMKSPYNYTNDKEKEKGIKALGIIEKIGIKIFDKPRQKVSEMRAKIRKVKHENPDKEVIIFIDYLTLIQASQNYKGNKHAEITEISADLKNMAKDFKCPVVCLAQLSRSVEQRDNKRPRMSDLRESGSIEQDADIIMLLYRDEYYNPDTEQKNVLEVDIAKNRDGEVGKVYLEYKQEINKIGNLYHKPGNK